MKILFVEDTDVWVKRFKPKLETLGEVTHFKSSNAARRNMMDNEYDLIVCDHNIQRFETERGIAYGNEVYEELRWMNELPTPFIHFSADPCPEKYGDKNIVDPNFYSMLKDYDADLMGLIKKIMK